MLLLLLWSVLCPVHVRQSISSDLPCSLSRFPFRNFLHGYYLAYSVINIIQSWYFIRDSIGLYTYFIESILLDILIVILSSLGIDDR